jgi:hypothetical protein
VEIRAARLALMSLAAAVVIAAWPASARTAPSSDGPFHLTSFVQRGRTDLRRNEMLEFRFSAPLKRGSVDERTLQVVEGRRPVIGARIVTGNVVRLDPRRTQRNYDATRLPSGPTYMERDHEIGFSGQASFEVLIRAGSEQRVLRSRDGGRITRRYAGKFGTGTLYLDPVPGQPEFAGDYGTGLLGFDPPRDGQTGLIAPGASIVFGFSEPIAPESMILGETVLVQRVSDGSNVEGTLAPFPIASSMLTEYRFTPTGGWGADGIDVAVSITTGVTDLAGNALKRPFGMPAFRTASQE